MKLRYQLWQPKNIPSRDGIRVLLLDNEEYPEWTRWKENEERYYGIALR
jgi:hypothetical protein